MTVFPWPSRCYRKGSKWSRRHYEGHFLYHDVPFPVTFVHIVTQGEGAGEGVLLGSILPRRVLTLHACSRYDCVLNNPSKFTILSHQAYFASFLSGTPGSDTKWRGPCLERAWDSLLGRSQDKQSGRCGWLQKFRRWYRRWGGLGISWHEDVQFSG